MIIRDGTIQDLDKIKELYLKYSYGYGEDDSYFKQHKAIVCEDSDIVAFALLHEFRLTPDAKTKQGLYLEALYVSPDKRHRKIATKLIETIIDYAKNNNFALIKLDAITDKDNADKLINLYKLNGFTRKDDSSTQMSMELTD